MNVLFVPSLGLDDTLIRRLAASVDYPVKWKCVLNNGPLGALEQFSRDFPDWHVKETGQNHGVAGSWNACSKWFSSEPAWLLMNEDAHFLPGYLERICSTSDHNQSSPLVYPNFTRPFYAFVWHKVGRETIGEFDENLWPAYYEDYDYRIRLGLAGMSHCPMVFTETEPPMPHGKPRTGGDNYSALINGCGLFNRAYMIKKWGGCRESDIAHYPTPYNDQRLAYRDWVWYPEERAMRWPLWNTFINMPNPSIYD